MRPDFCKLASCFCGSRRNHNVQTLFFRVGAKDNAPLDFLIHFGRKWLEPTWPEPTWLAPTWLGPQLFVQNGDVDPRCDHNAPLDFLNHLGPKCLKPNGLSQLGNGTA